MSVEARGSRGAEAPSEITEQDSVKAWTCSARGSGVQTEGSFL